MPRRPAAPARTGIIAVSPRRVTMHDVARRASVSQSLVSLVLAGNSTVRVTDGTRSRIVAAARELGYRPNVLARGLVQSRSYSLGIIVPDLRSPFFLDVVSGAERVATAEGYAVLVCSADAASAEKHIELLRGRQIDGIIIDAAGSGSLPEGALASLHTVLINEPSDEHHSVLSDAPTAGRLAGEHLLGLGHRRFGFLGPVSELWAFRMRERGFLQSLRAADINLESDQLRRVQPSLAGGGDGMRALLALEERPTAVFCANDLIALGALKACAAASVSVPADISIVGCEDIEAAQLVTPELTTIRVQAHEMGARAARLLIRLLGNERSSPRRGAAKRLSVELIIRKTTAPPRATPRPLER